MQFKGEVKNGKLTLENQKRFNHYLTGIDGVVSLSVKPYKEKRTDKQNALLWAIYTELSGHTGYTKEEMHELCKLLFNTKTILHDGKVLEYGGTTTTLNTKEFGEYVRSVEQWALEEYGIIINENELEYE